MFYSLPEEELRTICRVNIEAFEKWARTVIHSELTAHLGESYFDIELLPNVPVVKKSIIIILAVFSSDNCKKEIELTVRGNK